jgi:uncharacterized membrane protein
MEDGSMKVPGNRRRGISILVEAVVVAIMVISAFAVSYYYITPANPRLQRSQQDVSQLGYNILNTLAANGEFNDKIINGVVISNHYTSCSYANPSVSITPDSQWGVAGSQNTYTVTVVNNDNLCGVELFQLTLALPTSSWSGTIAIPTLSAASDGGSASTLVTISSPTTAGSGTYKFSVTATNIASTVPSASASASATGSFSIETGSLCVQNDPTVLTSPNTEYSSAGSNMSFSITITNNDKNCGLETFSVSVRPPSIGWSVVVVSPTVEIYSGGSAADTVYLSSPNNTPTGSYSTRVFVTNMENSSDSAYWPITYQISKPSSKCTYAQPGISITPSSESAVSGTTLTYGISLVNNDAGCGIESFRLSISTPSGFTYPFVPSLNPINITSGGSAGLTLMLTSQGTTLKNSYQFTVSVTNQESQKSNTVSGYYISTGPPTCQNFIPSISITPPSQWVGAGSSVDYTVTVVNNDLSLCGPENYTLSLTPPSSSWAYNINPQSNIINSAGGSATYAIQLASSSSILPGFYSFSVVATDQSNLSNTATVNGSYGVEAPCTTVTLSCLGKIGAIVPGWQRNIDVALLSVVPEGYIYNLTVYLAYSPPGQPYAVTDIPLNNGTLITNGVPQSFKNAGQVVDVLYVYTTPKLYVLLFQLQLAQVTSP